MSEFLRNTLDETKRRFTDRDYMRWRMKRRLIRFGLVILTLILLSPLIIVLKAVNAPPAVAMGVTVVGILTAMGLYAIVGMFGRPYEPPTATAPFTPQNSPTTYGTSYTSQPVPLEPFPPASATMPPIAPQKTVLGSPPSFAPAEPAPARTGGVLLALFGGCAVVALLSCGGLFALTVFGVRKAQPVPVPAAPFGQPNNGFGNQPFGAQRMAEEQRQRVEKMQREQQQRFEDMRKRHEEIINSNRR
jgi:hypothetical protein